MIVLTDQVGVSFLLEEEGGYENAMESYEWNEREEGSMMSE